MKITSISPANYYNQTLNTKGYYRTVCDKDGKLLYRATTYPFRDDLDWSGFIDLLAKKYANVPKVNIINHACSIGTESFCLAALLISELREKAAKFLPILAKDIDKENIEIAKANRLMDDIYGKCNITYHLGRDYNKFFEIQDIESSEDWFEDKLEIIPKAILRDKVIFEQADIMEDIETLPKSNTVIMVRNFWPYLSPDNREKLAQKLAESLDNSCLIVTGNFDEENKLKFKIGDLFNRFGIKETSINHVWQKML